MCKGLEAHTTAWPVGGTVAGGCEQGEWWEQSQGKDSGFYFNCGGEPLEDAGKGIKQFDKHFQEIILFAVKRINCREEWP